MRYFVKAESLLFRNNTIVLLLQMDPTSDSKCCCLFQNTRIGDLQW